MTIPEDDFHFLSSREMSFANAEGSLIQCNHQGKTWTWDLQTVIPEIQGLFDSTISCWARDDINTPGAASGHHLTPLQDRKDPFWYQFCIVIKHAHLDRNLKMINDIIKKKNEPIDKENEIIDQKNAKIEKNLFHRIIAIILKLFCCDYFAKVKYQRKTTLKKVSDAKRGGDLMMGYATTHQFLYDPAIPLDLRNHLTFPAGTPANEQNLTLAFEKYIKRGGRLSDYCSINVPGFDFDSMYRADPTTGPANCGALCGYIHGYRKDGLEPVRHCA